MIFYDHIKFMSFTVDFYFQLPEYCVFFGDVICDEIEVQISSYLFILLLFVLMHSPKMCLRVSAWMPQFIFVSFLTLWNAVLVQYAFVLNFNTFKYRDGFSNSGLYTHVFPILSPKNSCMPCPCEANDFHLLISVFFNLFFFNSFSRSFDFFCFA